MLSAWGAALAVPWELGTSWGAPLPASPGTDWLLAFSGCPVIITAFDLTDVKTLEHTR